MDRDLTRRGEPSLYHQYSLFAEEQGITEADHFGESFAICAGDIGFFLAFEMLSKLELESEIRERIQTSWSRAFTAVGLAQMQDMFFSGIENEVGEEEILDLYRSKTALYTFSLPLTTGAIAAGAEAATIEKLRRVGEYMGIAFQIRDDELDLFGREHETGKPVGTDIEEGKKTLYYLHLVRLLSQEGERLSERERESLQSIAQKGERKEKVFAELRKIAEKYGIRATVQQKMEELSREAEKLIVSLPAGEEYREILLDVLHYNCERRR
jgi:geranylgeranyl pyrophosphate synthase